MYSFRYCLFYIAITVFACCHTAPPKQVTPAFYYWKSVAAISKEERKVVDQLGVQKLYVKCFDVVWDKQTNSAVPVAKINIPDASLHAFTIIPVVFITNEVFQYTKDSMAIAPLANKVVALLLQIVQQYQLPPPPEIQFDCDWTATTKDQYFQLLRLIKEQLKQNGYGATVLSATIRLYQCRYLSKTGVPPVERGLLMCYNMGNLKNPVTNNSILEVKELEKYIGSLHSYPLPLDVALPLFDWKVLFRKGQYAGLVKELNNDRLNNNPAVTADGNRYTFLRDTSIERYTFYTGDVLRDEQSAYKDIMAAARLVNRQLNNQSLSVILYHLDSLTLSKYPIHELEDMLHSFY